MPNDLNLVKPGDKKVKISLFYSHNYVESELVLKDKIVVVIDVLRTSTTICAGLFNGAKEIIPAVDVATAGMLGRNSEGFSLLCGERYGKTIEGFNLGNSIKEYSSETVKGKTLIFSSSNGTPAIIKSKFAKICVICSFANISRVAEFISSLKEDFVIVCSGNHMEPSIEDTGCAGFLINTIMENKQIEYTMTDSARIASMLIKVYRKDLKKLMLDSEHGKYLTEIGFEDDLAECAKVDQFPVLPLMRNNSIRTLEGFETDPKLTMKKVSKSNK